MRPPFPHRASRVRRTVSINSTSRFTNCGHWNFKSLTRRLPSIVTEAQAHSYKLTRVYWRTCGPPWPYVRHYSCLPRLTSKHRHQISVLFFELNISSLVDVGRKSKDEPAASRTSVSTTARLDSSRHVSWIPFPMGESDTKSLPRSKHIFD